MGPGDSVVVDFDGEDHVGEVVACANGWVMARLVIDPLGDYGALSARLAPISTVCVPARRVRLVSGS